MVNNFITFVKNLFPITSRDKEIHLDNIYIKEDKIPNTADYRLQKKYRLEGKSLTVPVYGDFSLYEKGKKKGTATGLLIARVPMKLPRGSYLFKGNEFFISNQLRLKPGIYVRIRENGEVEAHFNLAKWTFKVFFNGKKIYAKFTRGPSIPFYTLLKLFGASENEIKNAFGDLYDDNVIYDENSIVGWYKAYYGEGIPEEAINTFKKVLSSGYRFDPHIINQLLNIKGTNINKDILLSAVKKLIAVRRGEKEPDDRDALFFKQLVDEDDILKEHFDELIQSVSFKIRRNLLLKDKIRDIVPIAFFQDIIDRLFTKELVNPLKETNPVTIAENNSRITIFGEGGIKSEYAVPFQARALNPSHFGIVDPVRTPESSKVGAVMFKTIGTTKDPDTKLPSAEVLDIKNKKLIHINASEFFDSRIAFPDQISEVKDKKVIFKNKNQVKVLYRGKIEIVPESKVDYVVPNVTNLFTVSTLFLPFLQSLHPNRASKAANTITQALPLKYKEVPLVQGAVGPAVSMDDIVGQRYSVRSPVDGMIQSVKNDVIIIKDKKGKKHEVTLADYLPLNQNSFITMHIKEDVKEGAKVKKDQILADTNFTKDGKLAIGVNALAAFMPFKHLNFEDGIVVSESFSKKLTSQRLFHFKYYLDPNIKVDKQLYRALYPHELVDEKYNKLDDEGIIKKGQVVKEGDIIVAGLSKKKEGRLDTILSRLSRKLVQPWIKKPLVWDKEFDGVVKDVVKTKQFISIVILTEEPSIVGDKLTNRHGAKGVIVHIIPDDQMPKLTDGRTIDIIFNPISILGRNNPSQVYEVVAGKIAEKLNQPIKIPTFSIDNTHKFIKNLTKKYGISDTETIIDPETNRKISGVMVGPMYIYKLEHQAEEKMSARYKGTYDQWDLTPAKGVDEPGQAVGLMELYSLLAHGTGNILKEMTTWKSEKNPLFWEAIENNLPPPPPNPTFVTRKFESLLRSSGIDVKKEGNLVRLMPLTKTQIKNLTGNRYLKNAKMVIAGTLKEEKGGLFDPQLTGGLQGDKWSAIKLPDKMPSPILLDMFSRLLNIKKKDIRDIILGIKELQGSSGPDVILKLLKSKSLDEYIKEAKESAEVAKKTNKLNELNKANLIIRFVKYMKENNIKWDEFFMDRLPVLPPRFRPIYTDRQNRLFHSDLNLLYRDIQILSDQIHKAREAGLPENELNNMKKDLYESIEILYGLSDPSSRYYGKRKPRGILDYIHGPKPKEGFYQNKVLRKVQDLAGRSVIVPNPGLHPDEIGIPEEMAWKIFEPFILSKLKTEFALSPAEARIELAQRSDKARKALELVAKERLVIINRAPSLYKYNMLSFRPKIVPGRAIHFPNIVVAAQGGDFDGDMQQTMTIIRINKNNTINLLDKKPPKWYSRFKLKFGGINMAGYIKLPVPISKDSEIYIVDLEDFPHREKAFESEGRIFYHVPEGIEVLVYDENTGSIKWAPVKYWSVHPNNKVWLVNTYYGKQIYTDEDDRAIYGINAETLEFTRAKPDLAKKLKLLIPNVKNFEVEGNLTKITFVGINNNYFKRKIVSEKELTYDFGYLFGYLVGDGWITMDKDRPKSISIAMSPKFRNTHMENLLKKELSSLVETGHATAKVNEYNPSKFSSSYKIELYSSEAANAFLPLIGHGSHKKHLPPFFLISPLEFRKGLLAGYIDSDGSVSISHAKKSPQLMINASTGSLRLAREIVLLAKSLGITANVTGYKSSSFHKQHWMITFSSHEFLNAEIKLHHPIYLQKLKEIPEIKESGAKMQTDLVPFNWTLFRIISPKVERENKSTYRRNARYGYISRKKALDFLKLAEEDFAETEIGQRWISIVRNKNVSWTPIKSVEKTEIEETGYDLTVPPYENFMNVEGLILSNTTSVHVPVTHEALQEAVKMLPSNNWIHEGRPDKIWLTPKIESIWGLYTITRDGKDVSNKFKFKNIDDALKAFHKGEIQITDIVSINKKKISLGRALVNRILPDEFRDPKIKLDKKSIEELMKQIFKKVGGKKGAEIAGKLNKLGGDFAYLSGFKLSLNDFTPKFEDELNKAFLASIKFKDPEKVNTTGAKLRSKILNSIMKQKDNTLVQLVESGTRAKKNSLMQLLASPVQLADVYDKPIPVIIPKGYSKGMDVIDYLFSSYGARKGAIEKTIRTGEPGELSKELVASAIDYVITMKDCGTKKGIVMEIDKADALNRALAEKVIKDGKVIAKRNEIVDDRTYQNLKDAKIKYVKVRSPLTCEAPDGICALCYGAKPDGTLPHIGEYVGLKSAQFLSEPVTQMSISSVHTGGLVKDVGTSFQDIRSILEMSNVPVRATIAKTEGKVEKIVKRPEGGYEIVINGESHVTSPWVEPKVKEGDKVAKSDIITSGLPHPKDIYNVGGLETARNFVVDYLDKAYQQNGIKMDRRHFEVLGKVMFDTGVITDPGDLDLVPGDYLKINKIKSLNSSLPTEIEIPLNDARGRILAEDLNGYKSGTKITEEIINKLNRKRTKKVKVRSKPASFQPVIKGVEQLPLLRDDWLTRMAYRDIKNTAIEGALRSWSSDLSGYSPIPKLVYGQKP